MSQWPVHIKLILLVTKIIKDVLHYSKGVQKRNMRNLPNLPFSQYEEKMKKDDHEGLKFQSCIFLVSKSHGFLGFSADGLVTDKSCENPLGLVEVKNIKFKENENLKMALVREGLVAKMPSLTRATFIATKFNNNHFLQRQIDVIF